MSNNAQRIRILDLLDRLLKSWWTVFAGVCLGLSAAVVALQFTPRIYEASATLDAYAESVSEDMIRSTVSADTEGRMQTLSENVLSGPRLKVEVREALGEDLAPDERDIYLAGLPGRILLSQRSRSRFFAVSCQDKDPRRAAVVANTVARLFVEEYRQLRAGLAGETTETLEELAAGTLAELRTQQSRIDEFRRRHPFESEDRLPMNYQRLAELKAQIEENTKSIRAVQEHIDLLRSQEEWESFSEYDLPADGGRPGSPPSPSAGGLSRLQAELDQLLLNYSENHPDVQAKKREIADLKARLGSAPPVEPVKDPVEEVSVSSGNLWDLQIRAAEGELQRLRDDGAALRRQKAAYEGHVASTPLVEQELRELSRGLDVLSGRYQEYQNKIEQAKAAQKVEEGQKGSQFRIVSAASPPSTPISPNVLMVLGIGAIAGLALFVGPPVVKQLLQPVVRSEIGLGALSELPILVRIPTIETAAVIRKTRRRRLKNFAFSAVSVAILAAVVALIYVDYL